MDPSQFLRSKFGTSRSYLHVACGPAGDLEAVRILVRPGEGKFNMRDGKGWTPLHFACYYGHPNIVEYLVNDIGHDTALDIQCTSPLQLACCSKSTEDKSLKIVQFLVAKGGFDPNK